MGRKKKDVVTNRWLTRDDIITKYFKDKKFIEKLEKALQRFGVKEQWGLLDDAIGNFFMEMSRIKPEKLEDLYNNNKGIFEGYLINMYKNCTLYTNSENPKYSVVSNILFASSMNTNAFYAPTETVESHYEGIQNAFIFNDEDLDDGVSFNTIWEHLELNLSTVEMRTLKKYFIDKRRPGILRKSTRKYLDQLIIKVRRLITEVDNSYTYFNKFLDDTILPDKQTKNRRYRKLKQMDNKEYIELCESVRQTAYDIINRKVNKITAEYKEALRKILRERFARTEIQSTNVSWGCQTCIIEITHNFTAYLESQRYLDLVASITPPAPVKKSTAKKKK